MTKLFGNLSDEGLEESQDRLGGYQPFETDVYTGKTKLVYGTKSNGGAQGLVVHIDCNGREYRETLWLTSKQGNNYWERDGKKFPLPGFTVADELALVLTNKPLAEQDSEERVIKLWNPETQKEEPTPVQVLPAMMDKEAMVAIEKSLVNVNKKNPSSGNYEPTADTRNENNIVKVFHADSKRTVPEIRAGEEDPTFHDEWIKAKQGQTRDKRDIKDGQAGASGAPSGDAPANTGSTERKGLFDQ